MVCQPRKTDNDIQGSWMDGCENTTARTQNKNMLGLLSSSKNVSIQSMQSGMAWNFRETESRLCAKYIIILVGVSGHTDQCGNKQADAPARQESQESFFFD